MLSCGLEILLHFLVCLLSFVVLWTGYADEVLTVVCGYVLRGAALLSLIPLLHICPILDFIVPCMYAVFLVALTLVRFSGA